MRTTDELDFTAMSGKKEIRRRWDKHTSVLPTSSLGRNEDGQEDFRGFPLSRFGRVLQTKFKNCDFTDADFSNSWIESCTFESCRFFGTDFLSFHDEHNRFLDCQFVKADFRNAAIGFGTSEYSNCTFEDCNFMKVVFANAIFEGVSFFQDFKRIDFNASGFWNCSFFWQGARCLVER